MPDPALQEAIILAKRGKRKEAEVRVSTILTHEPQNADAWIVMAQLTTDQQRAAECWRYVLQLRPGDEKARAALQKLGVAIDPTPPPAKKKHSLLGYTIGVIAAFTAVFVCLCFVLSASLRGSGAARRPTATSYLISPTRDTRNSTPSPPGYLDISDPSNTGIPEDYLKELQSAVFSYGDVVTYEAALNRNDRIEVFADIDLGGYGSRKNSLAAFESALRSFAALKSRAGKISLTVCWDTSVTCCNSAGMGANVIASIDWENATQRQIFSKIDQQRYSDTSNYSDVAFAPQTTLSVAACNR